MNHTPRSRHQLLSDQYNEQMQKISFFVVAAILFLFTSSCRVIRPSAPDIESVPVPSIPPSQSSIVNVPVTVDLTGYFKKAEEMVPAENSGSDNPCEGVRYKYYFKRNPLKISGKGMRLDLQVDGAYSMSGSYCAKCMFGSCVLKTPT